MAVKTNITINIVEPGSDVPVPDTGLFTHGIGGTETTIIVSAALVTVLVILSIVLTIYMYRKHKKQGRTTKLVHIIDQTKAVVKSKKRITIGLSIIAFLVSACTFTAFMLNTNKSNTSAIEGNDTEQQTGNTEQTENTNNLTINAESKELTIEVKDQPVFAVLPVQVTVEEATQAGYTLTAYTDNTDLVSTTNPNNKIPMVTVEGDELTSLKDNTWGLALDNEPTAKDNKVYTALSTDQTNPTLITDKDYEETEANDTTTIYYGFYITPDIPYGTYTGGNITVDAFANIATVTYDANGLYYNDDETSTENIVGYKPNIAEAPIEEVTGEYMAPAPLTTLPPTHYTFLGWSEDKDATEATYTSEEDILSNLTLTKNESLTLYAVWHYDTVLSFDGNTSDGGTSIQGFTMAAGDTISLPPNTYTRTGSVFTGWNTVADGTGEAYADEASFTAPDASADITLYAQWAYTTIITFNGNGETSGSMASQTIIAGTPQNLTQNAFAKDGYIFNGWNTVQTPTTENPGTTYADKANYTAGTESNNVTLYAQWKEPLLYNYVKDLVKKNGNTELTQSVADLQATITTPTTTDPATDTSNSGVYKYDATTFGTASDASNDYDIYYYRGILEPTYDQGNQGSDGKATTYPNYVRLHNDTCWRIVRTTGSGGVKMIYNGTWQSASNTCANSGDATQIGTSTFNGDSSTNHQIVRVGYTYNSSYAVNTNGYGTLSEFFGTNEGDSNNTSSNAKIVIDQWYENNLNEYTDILEDSAGFCGDRVAYRKKVLMAETYRSKYYFNYDSTTTHEDFQLEFGSYFRNSSSTSPPSLTCAIHSNGTIVVDRSKVDLYSKSGSNTGNGRLSYPIALLSADETSFIGAGTRFGSSSYSWRSYLMSGSWFWLLSPYYRGYEGSANVLYISLYTDGGYASYDRGLRPVISLKHGVTVISGFGTATDPWIINE